MVSLHRPSLAESVKSASATMRQRKPDLDLDFPISEEQKLPLEDFMALHPEWYASEKENPTFVDKLTLPFRSANCYRRRLVANYTLRFLTMLASTYVLVKGFIYNFVFTGMQPFFLSYIGVDASAYQFYYAAIRTPWALKSFYGMLSDAYPLGGYQKRYYLIAISIITGAAYAVLFSVNFTAETAWIATICLFFTMVQSSMCDLLVEGKYAEMMVSLPRTGADVVTFVWYGYYIGYVISSVTAGPLADHARDNPSFWTYFWVIPLPLAIQILVPLFMGYLPEKKVPAVFQKEVFVKNKKIFIYAFLLGVGSILNAVVGLLRTQGVLPSYSVLVFLGGYVVPVMASSFWLLPVPLAKSNLYMFICSALYFDYSGAAYVFYTDQGSCIEDGPQFSNTFYFTYMGLAASAFSMIGITLFQAIMGNWKFRAAFWVTTCVKCFGGLVDFIIYNRYNIAVGIPDGVMYFVGNAIFYNLVYMLDYMPAVVLTSKLCPKNMESTTYALLAGCQNFGQNIAAALGGYAMTLFSVSTVEPCNTENLGTMALVLAGCIPLLSIPLTFILIPDVRMTENLEHIAKELEEDQQESNVDLIGSYDKVMENAAKQDNKSDTKQ